ncbi:biosynthetic-type acetolactate synthase large subunit [Desulfovibrio inopinatus]|uniref:biosynthetic-type acetolactate synthase large subunit n=1 Tax=Desulfovibrio inopinatus TaxID=102109 RepID=UPI0003FA682A|nr:biosynthetic-type acetolactate synthase large subunit [Desulfovibrio inopinatus]
MSSITGAELLIRLIERQNIRLIAGIPGGANLPMYHALSKSTQIRHVLTRHEQGAGFFAQGVARATGEPAVCFATSGPGATNLITAIADARMDSIPLVAITGQVPTSLIGADAFQEVDIYGLTIPIAKHNFLARSAEELLDIIPQAFRIAASGRPGPVLVDVPRDVQMESITVDIWPEPGRPDPSPVLDTDAMAEAAHMINTAQRPVLCLGAGTLRSGASHLALQLARKADMPVAMTLQGLGAVASNDPLSLGLLGMHGDVHANYALAECDLFIAVGMRFDDRATGKATTFCPNASIIHIDIDKGELDKIKTAHVGIHADVAESIQGLLPLVREQERPSWRMRIAAIRQHNPPQTPIKALDRPAGIITAVANTCNRNPIVVTDVGQHQMWAAKTWPHNTPGHWLTSGGLGTMGFGLPAAIGAAMATGKKTICFSGDGSILMNIQELATLAETGADVTLVVLNNNALGLVCQQQELFFDKTLFASTFTHQPDFTALASAFGLPSFTLTPNNAATVLDLALNTPGPALVHAPVCVDNVYPMVPPGADNTTMIQGDSHDRVA